MDLIWLIPILPGIGAAINGLIGIRSFSRQTSGLVACAAMAGALGLSLYAFWELLSLAPEVRDHVVSLGHWIPPIPLATAHGIGSFEVPWAFRLDPLSGMMILVVTGIGFLIHIYSTAYMHDEPRGGYARFFSYLNLFCFFMLILVLGSSFVTMFVGWEGVGLCSYLLIGYWYEKKSASDAGKKAFIVNRIGDWGFILGVFLIFYTFGTLDFRAVANAAGALPVETQFGVVSLICLLLFIGATGKSAQIPLYVWLPDAMEGPTPVSALIHAATMVTAGVYMVGRNAVLFAHAPMVAQIVMIVGALTALMGGDDRSRPVRHQERACVLDCVAARLHVSGDGRRRLRDRSRLAAYRHRGVRGRGLPLDDARIFQGAAVSWQRIRDPCDGGRAGHAAGWAD